MGFSVSASTAIVFAGLFLAFGIFYPAAVNGYERVTEAQAAQTDAALNEKNSDIALANAEISGGELVVDVDNTGSTTLYVDEVDLLVEDQYVERSAYNTEVGTDENTNLWVPGTELTITDPDTNAQSGDRVTVVTEHGIRVSGVIA